MSINELLQLNGFVSDLNAFRWDLILLSPNKIFIPQKKILLTKNAPLTTNIIYIIIEIRDTILIIG